MRKLYIVVTLLALSVTACAKKKGETKQAPGNFMFRSYMYNQINQEVTKCSGFQKGSRLKTVAILPYGVGIHTKSYGQGEPTSMTTKSGLLLTFDNDKTFLMEVEPTTGRYVTKADLEAARRDVLLISKSSRVFVDCQPSTNYTTKGDLSSLRFIDRWGNTKPEENAQSTIDGTISIGDVEL